MSARRQQNCEQVSSGMATDADQPSSSSLLTSIWNYRSPLADDQWRALDFFQTFGRSSTVFSSGNQYSSLSPSSSSFQSADVTSHQHQTEQMDFSTLKSEGHFHVKEGEEAVKPLQAEGGAVALPPATASVDQSVQSLINNKQVEEIEKEEMQSFIAASISDSSALPPSSRPPSYSRCTATEANFFSFPQPSKEWHQSLYSSLYATLSQQQQQHSSSVSPPPSPPPPYVITTATTYPLSPLRSASRSTSRLHHFIKYLLAGSTFYSKKNKKKKGNKLPQKSAEPSLEQDYQATDRLERAMKRVTLYVTLLILAAILVLIVQKCTAITRDDADSKRNLMQQQIVAPSSGRLDLSQFENLKGQLKVNRPRPSAERLQEAASRRSSSSSEADKRRLLIAGLEGQVLAGASKPNSASGIERENSEVESIRHLSPPQVVKPKPYNPPPAFSQRKPAKVPVSQSRPHLLGDDCSRCTPAKYLAHYGLKECSAVFSVECNCAKYYRCPQVRIPAKPVIKFGDDVSKALAAGCQHSGQRFAFGATIPMLSEPCRICRCRKRRYFNGTDASSSPTTVGEIDCSPYIECPEMVFGVKASPGCHFAYEHEECCGRQVCPDELPKEDLRVRTVCRYRGKEYKYGEKIYPEEDTCKKCICNEHWNDHDPVGSVGSCSQVRCTGYLKEEITRKCTPIYRADGCCPIDYICPPQRKLYDSSDDQLDQTTAADEIPQSCRLQGKSYGAGRQLYIERTDTHHGRVCAKCSCSVPPLFTCMADFRCTGQV